MKELNEYLEIALKFHGHKCPAMPMGLRAGLAAMKALGVERSSPHLAWLRFKKGISNHCLCGCLFIACRFSGSCHNRQH